MRLANQGLRSTQDAPARPLQQSLVYVLLVFVLSIPFWLVGGRRLPLPMKLPASSLMWVNPALAASLLTYRAAGSPSLRQFLKRAVDYRKIQHLAWYLPILFLVPGIYIITYLLMKLVGLPLPRKIVFRVVEAPILVLAFLIPALSEELGWSGYATDRLESRWSALKTSLVVGLVWQVWHIVPDLQVENSPAWIVWHGLYSVALRVLIVWTYNRTGRSVLAAALVHTTDNVSWSLFPNDGSHFDPAVAALVAWTAAVVILVRGWPAAWARSGSAAAGQ